MCRFQYAQQGTDTDQREFYGTFTFSILFSVNLGLPQYLFPSASPLHTRDRFISIEHRGNYLHVQMLANKPNPSVTNRPEITKDCPGTFEFVGTLVFIESDTVSNIPEKAITFDFRLI